MVINVAINGFGRIGRMFFRTAYKDKNINVVAVRVLQIKPDEVCKVQQASPVTKQDKPKVVYRSR